MSDNNLQHHGVLGMKWGIRRYQPYPKGEGKKGTFLGKKKKHTRKKEKINPTKGMSDAELRRRINRLQMEKQYKQLTAKEKSTGVKIAGSVLSKIGNKVADRVIDRTIVNPIDDFIKGKMKI